MEIEQWGGGTALAGRVKRIEPSGFLKISALGVEEQRVNVIMNLIDPPERWPGLGDGFRVEVRVVMAHKDNVLQVPTSALFCDQQGWVAFAVEDGKAVRRRVKVGAQNGLRARSSPACAKASWSSPPQRRRQGGSGGGGAERGVGGLQ